MGRAWLYMCYGCGVALVMWAAVDWFRAASFQQLAIRGKGMVIGAHEQNLGGGRASYFIQVEFMTADGRRHKFSSTTGKPKPPRIGEELAVVYDPVMPERAEVDEPDDKSLLRILLAATGACLILIGVVSAKSKAGTPSH